MKIQDMESAGPEVFIARGALDADLAREVAKEKLRSDRHGRQVIASGTTVASVIEGKHYSSMFPATRKAFEQLSEDGWITEEDFDRIAHFNSQMPHGQQPFHRDRTDDPSVFVVHCSDNGAYDFAPGASSITDALRDHETASTNAGDIVLSLNPKQLHRGRNPSDVGRLTIAFANVRFDL